MRDLDDIRLQLDKAGIVKLEGLISVNDAREAHDKILELARDHGLYADGRWVKSQTRFGCPKSFRNALNKLNRSVGFPKLFDDQMVPMIEELVGASVAPLAPGQQILFSLPCNEAWTVPHDVWHTDLPKFAERSTPGLQAFTFLDDVEAGGGATLVVAGSHRLLNQFASLSSRGVKQRLKDEQFFEMLFDPDRSAIMSLDRATGHVGEVDVSIVELTGGVGDVYLMDLRVLHAPAPNSLEKARLMPTCRFPTLEVASKFGVQG